MRDQLKSLAIIVMVFVVGFGTIYFASRYFIEGEFNRLENEDMSRNTLRAVDALHDTISQLRQKVSDWASWDEAYTFVQDHNAKFADENITDYWIRTIGINFMVFIDAKGNVVALKGTDIQSGREIFLPGNALGYFIAQSNANLGLENSVQSGILGGGKWPLLFASQTILRSDRSGSPAGTLVFAVYLDDAKSQKLAELTHQRVAYRLLTDETLDPQIRKLGSTYVPKIVPVDDDTIDGYHILPDVTGAPYLAVQVTESRDFRAESQNALRYFSLINALVLGFSLLIISRFFNRIREKDTIIRLKNDFFAMGSHEIRAPLIVIREYALLLRQTYAAKLDVEFSEIVHNVYISVERLLGIVTNFIDTARLEEQKIPFENGNFPIMSVAQEVLDEIQPLVFGKDVKLSNDIRDESISVHADKDRVKQVIYNLVGNSLKFTEKGSVTVTAYRQPDGNVKILITDTGSGIDKSKVAKLFHMFEQAKSYDANKGFGLGLYISRLLVEQMGGKINIEHSELGEGTTIGFTLPSGA